MIYGQKYSTHRINACELLVMFECKGQGEISCGKEQLGTDEEEDYSCPPLEPAHRLALDSHPQKVTGWIVYKVHGSPDQRQH